MKYFLLQHDLYKERKLKRINRTQSYAVATRPARILDKIGNELWLTFRTVGCQWMKMTGGCKFCGSGHLDAQFKTPLTVWEAEAQTNNSFRELTDKGVDPLEILKLSLIGYSDGLLHPEVIKKEALESIISISSGELPNLREISIESRPEQVSAEILGELGEFIERLYGKISLEIVHGAETAEEKKRLAAGKGITDKMIFETANLLARKGWQYRFYYMYNMLDRENNLAGLLRMVDFLARLNQKTEAQTSLLVIRGFLPEEKKSEPLFKGWKDLPDKTILADYQKASFWARDKGIFIEFDSTIEDQEDQEAEIPSSKFRGALERYNITLNPEALTLD